jgi:hypothetical protein
VLFELSEATPEEVRRFLAQLLIENRGFSVDDAGSIASKWARGSGKDLGFRVFCEELRGCRRRARI